MKKLSDLVSNNPYKNFEPLTGRNLSILQDVPQGENIESDVLQSENPKIPISQRYSNDWIFAEFKFKHFIKGELQHRFIFHKLTKRCYHEISGKQGKIDGYWIPKFDIKNINNILKSYDRKIL